MSCSGVGIAREYGGGRNINSSVSELR